MPAKSATENAAKVVVHFRAIDCFHWNRPDKQNGFLSMKDSGYEPSTLVDADFVPDLAKLTRTNGQALRMLGSILGELDQSQTRILLKAVTDSNRLRSVGMWFGQPLYWCSSGTPNKSRLDQWFSCFAVGLSKTRRRDMPRVTVSATLGDGVSADSLLTVDIKSLATTAVFQGIRKRLERDGKLTTPARYKSSLLTWRRKSEEDLRGAPPGLEEVLEKAVELAA